jgi:hypothetical protein
MTGQLKWKPFHERNKIELAPLGQELVRNALQAGNSLWGVTMDL